MAACVCASIVCVAIVCTFQHKSQVCLLSPTIPNTFLTQIYPIHLPFLKSSSSLEDAVYTARGEGRREGGEGGEEGRMSEGGKDENRKGEEGREG